MFYIQPGTNTVMAFFGYLLLLQCKVDFTVTKVILAMLLTRL